MGQRHRLAVPLFLLNLKDISPDISIIEYNGGGYLQMIKWDDKFLIGVDIIDQQHKELFRIANDAYSLLKSEFYTDKYDKVVQLIEELKNYAVFHFETEENYMMEIGYKKFLSHKVVHDDFVEKVKKVNLEHMDENQDEYLTSILMFVVDWIENHILKTDKQIEIKGQ